jgi:hypothetical protein
MVRQSVFDKVTGGMQDAEGWALLTYTTVTVKEFGTAQDTL